MTPYTYAYPVFTDSHRWDGDPANLFDGGLLEDLPAAPDCDVVLGPNITAFPMIWVIGPEFFEIIGWLDDNAQTGAIAAPEIYGVFTDRPPLLALFRFPDATSAIFFKMAWGDYLAPVLKERLE